MSDKASEIERLTFNQITRGSVLFLPFKYAVSQLNIPEFDHSIKPACTSAGSDGECYEYIVIAKNDKTLTTTLVFTVEKSAEAKMNEKSIKSTYKVFPIGSSQTSSSGDQSESFTVKYKSDSESLVPTDVKRWTCASKFFEYTASSEPFNVYKNVQISRSSYRALINLSREDEAALLGKSVSTSIGIAHASQSQHKKPNKPGKNSRARRAKRKEKEEEGEETE